MSLSKVYRNFRPKMERKLSTAEITADVYARSFSDAAKRSWVTAKACARALGINLATAKNLWNEKNGLSGVHLIRGVRESDEFLWTFLELADRADIVEKLKAIEHLDEAYKALSKLKGGGE